MSIPTTRPMTRAQRVKELLANLPPNSGLMPATELDADEQTPVVLEQDGKTLVGTAWVTPDAYLEDDIEAGLLPSWKGVTDVVLPTLADSAE